jgi:hypothetical protein
MRLLNAQTGEYLPVDIVRQGRERINVGDGTVPAQAWRCNRPPRADGREATAVIERDIATKHRTAAGQQLKITRRDAARHAVVDAFPIERTHAGLESYQRLFARHIDSASHRRAAQPAAQLPDRTEPGGPNRFERGRIAHSGAPAGNDGCAGRQRGA